MTAFLWALTSTPHNEEISDGSDNGRTSIEQANGAAFERRLALKWGRVEMTTSYSARVELHHELRHSFHNSIPQHQIQKQTRTAATLPITKHTYLEAYHIMSSGLMETEKGGEQTQYEAEHSDMLPHKQEAGQLGGTNPFSHSDSCSDLSLSLQITC